MGPGATFSAGFSRELLSFDLNYVDWVVEIRLKIYGKRAAPDRPFFILMKVFDEQNKYSAIYRFAALVFPLNLAATAVSIAFDVSSQRLASAFSLENIVTSFTYSNCIGTLICIVFIFFSPQWSRNSLFIRLLKVISTIFAGTFLGVISARFILSFIFPHLGSRNLIPGWRSFVFASGIAFTFGFAVYFYEILQTKLRQKELDEEKAKTLATEAQLASLNHEFIRIFFLTL